MNRTQNLSAEQIIMALINSRKKPVNDSAKIKQAWENDKKGRGLNG